MTNEQWYALGIISGGSWYHKERTAWVLKVRRTKRSLLRACQRAFGGKVYKRSGGAYTWILRGKELAAFRDNLPMEYPVL